MQSPVPLQYEFQINGRVELTVLGTGLHQSNLTTTVDAVIVNGVDNDPTNITTGSLKAALETAIKNWLVDNKDIPA